VRPETSGVRPETSGVRPETSGVRPETSGVRHDTSISYKKLSSEKNVYKLYTYFDYVF